MAIVKGDDYQIFVGTVEFRGRPYLCRIDLVGNFGLPVNFRSIVIEAKLDVPDTNITSKQDMQFTRELNARGNYVLG